MPTTRRSLLKGAALASAAAAAAQTPASWFDKPMRWSQLTLAEDDPGSFDPKFWLDFFRRIHSDAICLSAGGCIAYYPTKIPYHYKSKWMGSTDPFGDMVKGCRDLGMVVVARTDPHAIHDDAAKVHPEWIHRDAQGRPRPHWATPGLWVTCALGPYNFTQMTEVTREIVSTYKVDGIFSNRWAGHGVCYCDSCRALFRGFCGMDIPATDNPRDPARRNYIVWREKRLFELWRLWDGEIRKINPDACFIANAGGGALSSLDMKTIGELAPTLFADRQARRGLAAPWSNGKNGKEYRATLGRKAIAGIVSVGVEEPYRWKDSVQTEAEIRIWFADGTANGLRPWYTKFCGKVFDRRWLGTIEKIYDWHWRNERYLRNEEPLARVAMVYSQQTGAFYGGPQAGRKVEDHIQGFYHALIEARIPFEMVHEGLLDAAHIDRYKVLVLANVAALSDAQCRQLQEYVARGGGIVATFETSLYNEWGARRADFGLADLFGVRFAGKVAERMQNSYLRVENPAHPLLRGMEDAERIINGVQRVDVTASVPMRDPPLTLVPSYPDLPMEEVYPRVPRTDIPEVYLREHGRGRVVYFPWDIDRTFWEVMSPDHGRLLANAVDWAANEERPVTVTGSGVLDVTLWRQKESLTVHLVNLTNPMMMKGPFREFIPVGQQTVRLRLPQDARPRKVHLLTAQITPRSEFRDGWLEVVVPSVLDHEVVAVDVTAR